MTLQEQLNEVDISGLAPEVMAEISRLLAKAPRRQGMPVADYMIPVPLPGARVPDEPQERYSWGQSEPMD